MSTASVESPLQLLSAVEATHAGLLGSAVTIYPREGVAGLAATSGAVRAMRLPTGLVVDQLGATVPGPRSRGEVWAIGDPYSGQVQSALLGPLGARHVVVLDDGLATLRLVEQLAAPRPSPLTRHRTRPGPHRWALALAAGWRLRALVQDGRLTVFTALPFEERTVERFKTLGGHFVRHRFEWLDSQPAVEPAPAADVVVGSALPADGLVRSDRYLAWVNELADHGPTVYLPHRRERRELLERVEQHPNVTVDRTRLPVELRLRALARGRRVACLPSTAFVTLHLVLVGLGVRITAHPVPEDWWTSKAPASLRQHLADALELARTAGTAPGHLAQTSSPT